MAIVPLTIKDDDVTLTSRVASVNFVGPGVSATTDPAGNVQVRVDGCDGGLVIQDEGLEVIQNPDIINFVGGGVTATLDCEGVVTINIPGANVAPVFPTVVNPSLTYPFQNQSVQISDLQLRASPFIPIPPANVTHVSSGWQVALDPVFTNIVFESQPDTVNKTTITPIGLFVGQSYYARVRYYGSDGFVTAYSAVRFFTVIADIEELLPGQFLLPDLEGQGLYYIEVFPDYTLITGDGFGSGLVAKTTDFGTFLCRRPGNNTTDGEFARKGSEILIASDSEDFNIYSLNDGETFTPRVAYPLVGGGSSNVNFFPYGVAASANKFFVTGEVFADREAQLLSATTVLGPWTLKNDFPPSYRLRRIATDGGVRVFIAADMNGQGSPFFLFSEDDGLTFTELPISGGGFPPISFLDAKFLNGKILFVGREFVVDMGDLNNPVPSLYSVPTLGRGIFGVTYGGGFYYVCGTEGIVFRSSNLIDWVQIPTDETSLFYDCAYKDGILILTRLFGGLKYIPVG